MFNPAKVISLALAGIALIFIAGCGANKSPTVLIASRPPEQPVEVSQDNAGEDEVLPLIPLNLSGSARLDSEAAPEMTILEGMEGDGVTIPVVENNVISEKLIELEGNRGSKPVPMIENQNNRSEQSPEILRRQQFAIPTQENEANAALIDKFELSPLTHWEQRWLAEE